jgi:hypothetical protein
MKNRIIEFVKIIVVSVLTTLTWLIFQSITRKNDAINCEALLEFHNTNYLNDFFEILLILVIIIAIWFISVLIYYYLKSKQNINVYLYFITATLIALSTIYFRPKKEQNIVNISDEMNRVICKKGSDDGTLLQLENLTNEEYNYLQHLKKWWPEVPNEASSIHLEYHRDDFLGDFYFEINLDLPNTIEIDTLKYPEWRKIEGKYHYSKSQN